jgi:large subunit ribosomal protein L37Ae
MGNTKIVKAAGRFGVRYGQSVKRRIAKIEEKQRKKQACIFCNGQAKRLSKGIWECKKCGKKFAGHAYYLENEFQRKTEEKAEAKVLKEENPIKTEAKKKKAKKS